MPKATAKKKSKETIAPEDGVDIVTEPLENQLPQPPAAASDGERRVVPFSALQLSPLNPRKHFDDAQIAALADNIGLRGVQQNLLVRPCFAENSKSLHTDAFEIVAGANRYKAGAKLIADGRTAADYLMPVLVRALTDREVLEDAMAENLGRQSLTPMEEAEGFAALRAQGATTAEMAARSGVTQRYVQQRLSLVDKLEPKVKKALDDGTITFSHARALTMAPPKEQARILKQITRERDDDEAPWTEHDIRSELLENLPRDKDAIFDRALYTGEIRRDEENGIDYFADVKMFDRLQDEAIKAKAEELKATHDRVLILRENEGKYFYEEDYQPIDLKAKVKEKTTAVIVVGYEPGEIKFFTGGTYDDAPPAPSRSSSTKADTKTADAPKKASPPEDAFQKSHRVHAHVRKTFALQRALMDDAAAAQRVVCAAILIDGSYRSNGFDPVNLTVNDDRYGAGQFDNYDGPRVAPELGERLAKVAAGAGVKVAKKGGLEPRAHNKAAEVWEWLAKLKPDQVAKLLAALVAANTGTWCDTRGPIDDSDEAFALADHLGLAGKEKDHGLTLELGDLENLRKPALLGICARLKIKETKDGGEISENTKAGDLRDAIAAKLKMGPTTFVLPTLAFATGKGMDDAVKALVKDGK